MTTSTHIQHIIEKYKAGHRYFLNLDFDKGEKLNGQLLADTTFENCCFSVDFSHSDFTNARFIDCILKTCDFSNSNLTNTIFENCFFENAEFKNAKIDDTTFFNCNCHGQGVTLNKTNGKIEIIIHPLVKELYDNVPEFGKIADHLNEDLSYMVFDELSTMLFDNIINNIEITDFTKKCFQFFNLLGRRNDKKIDNLLVVSVYEELYSNKKCNDIARQLLIGQSKDIYEYWMKNGNINANY